VLVGAVVLVAACLALFVLIAEDLADGGGLVSRDATVLNWFVDHRTDVWVNTAKFVSTVAGFASLACVGVVLGLWLWPRGWHLAIAPLISLLLAGLASTVAKAAFGRARPSIVVREAHVTSPAFPSGHAADAAGFFLAAAFVLALTIAHQRRTQLLVVGVGMFFAVVVGLSRLILAVHWLSDVVAGWALGTAVAIAVVVVLWCVAVGQRNRNQRRQESSASDS
jgi:membrane-associated phospholipid phosphatase